MTLRFLSICSGIEGASLAFEPLGWTAVGFAEIKPFPCALLAERYGSNLPGEPLSRNAPPNYGDFTTIDTASLGEVDILVGGTPCQAFSVAGKRLSLADARGNLTLAFGLLAHELARNNGLRNVIWENVPGVLSSRDNAFGCFLGILVGSDDALLPCERPRRGRSNQFWRWEPAGRKPVLDDDGEPTGETVETPEGHIARWPRAGMASGPRARLAWRVLDAQYHGVPQRRERVFVVVDFGTGADPCEVLFEPQGVRGNTPPSRETREGTAAASQTSVGRGGDTVGSLCARTGRSISVQDGAQGHLVAAFGGGNRSGPVEQAATLTAKGQRCDFEVETFVAHALRGEGFDASEDGTGRGTPIVPVAFSACEISDTLGVGANQTTGFKSEVVAVAFDTTQITSPDNRRNPQPVAFAQNTRDEVRLQNGDGSISGALSSQPGMKQTTYVAQAFDLRGRDGGAMPEGPHDTAAPRAASGGSSRSYVAQGAETRWAVRRLTPIECERLQSVPDNYTRIAWRGCPADECPDSHRYEAVGNSWAVPVVRWIGERLDRAMPGGRAP